MSKLFFLLFLFATQLPDSKLDKALELYEESIEAAGEKYVKDIDKQVSLIRKRRDFDASKKQIVIDAIDEAKAEFASTGQMPFIPLLMNVNARYLLDLKKARLPVEKAFQRGIDTALRLGNDDEARDLREQRDVLLTPVKIAIIECAGIDFKRRFTWTLYHDGTATITTHENRCNWIIERGNLVIRNSVPAGPKQGYIDRFSIEIDGKSGAAKNQKGGDYKATFLNIPTK